MANGLQQCNEQFATMWRTFGECAANGLQQCNIQKQKPYFCNSKTPFLHVKNHTFVMRICNIQKTNTLRTFRECILNGLRMRGEYVYAGTINRTPTAANRLRMRCEQIAKHC